MSDKFLQLKNYIEEVKNMSLKTKEEEVEYQTFNEASSEIPNERDNSDLLSDYSGFILRDNIEQLELGLGQMLLPRGGNGGTHKGQGNASAQGHGTSNGHSNHQVVHQLRG